MPGPAIDPVTAYRSTFATLAASASSSTRTASGAFESVASGGWHLSVDAIDGTLIVRYHGETDVDVRSGETAHVDLVLVPTTGRIKIHVRWGEDNRNWSSTFGVPGAIGNGVEMLSEYDGDLIVGGGFTSIGGIEADGIARWDGTTWHPIGSGVGGSGQVWTAAHYGTDLIVGGTFTTMNGEPARYVARWDGSSWHAMGDISPRGEGKVQALLAWNDTLYASGALAQPDGSQTGVARWDGSAWQYLPYIGVDASALAVYQAHLIVGGGFPLHEGGTAYIAQWTGSDWEILGGDVDGGVSAMLQYGPDLIAVGWFTTAGGTVAVNHAARWDATAWHAMGDGMDDIVGRLTIYHGDLIAGGAFSHVGTMAWPGIARWNGNAWRPLGAGLDGTREERSYLFPSAFAVTTYDGALVVGGRFDTAGEKPARDLALWRD